MSFSEFDKQEELESVKVQLEGKNTELNKVKTKLEETQAFLEKFEVRGESNQNSLAKITIQRDMLQKEFSEVHQEKEFKDEQFQAATGTEKELLVEQWSELSDKEEHLIHKQQKLEDQAEEKEKRKKTLEERIEQLQQKLATSEAKKNQLQTEIARLGVESKPQGGVCGELDFECSISKETDTFIHAEVPLSSLVERQRHEEEPLPQPEAGTHRRERNADHDNLEEKARMQFTEVTQIENCFPGDAIVTTDKGPKPIKELVPGEMVLCVKSFPTIVFSEFLTFLHQSSTQEKYLQISTVKGTTLHVSHNHLVFTVDDIIEEATPHAKFAGEVTASESLICLRSSSQSHELSIERIQSIVVVKKSGAYAPLTRSGTIIVSKALVSCYASYPLHAIAHSAFLPLRMYFSITGNHVKKPSKSALHPYALLLQQTVATLNFV